MDPTIPVLEHWQNKDIIDIVEIIDGEVVTEKWQAINGYENLYSISNFGRILCIKILKNGERKNAIKTLRINTRGYLQIGLWSNSICKTFIVHRLVAIAFIPNPYNLPEVNHKFGNKRDNRVSSLE